MNMRCLLLLFDQRHLCLAQTVHHDVLLQGQAGLCCLLVAPVLLFLLPHQALPVYCCEKVARWI